MAGTSNSHSLSASWKEEQEVFLQGVEFFNGQSQKLSLCLGLARICFLNKMLKKEEETIVWTK